MTAVQRPPIPFVRRLRQDAKRLEAMAQQVEDALEWYADHDTCVHPWVVLANNLYAEGKYRKVEFCPSCHAIRFKDEF